MMLVETKTQQHTSFVRLPCEVWG